MKSIVDENNPYAREAFSTLGEAVALPGRQITRENLRDAEILACRSTIKINADLLENTAVRWIGTATIGFDHLDTAYLERKGIRYCTAPGSNADSVADYMTAVLLFLAEKQGTSLEGKTIGVIGCGNVGSRVVKRARALGMRVLENDPPLARQTGDPRYRPLDELFDADYLTLHTPLSREGADATFHLANDAFIRRMRKSAVLINASRGAVADGDSLRTALRDGRIAAAVLDVWEGEPSPNPELAALAALGTPHIAGHSFDGKVNGTMQIYRRICDWLGQEPVFDVRPHLPEPEFPRIETDAAGRSDEEVLREVVFTVYPILEDDARFREAMRHAETETRAAAFTALRKNYPRRREFSWTAVRIQNSRPSLAQKFLGLSFQVEEG